MRALLLVLLCLSGTLAAHAQCLTVYEDPRQSLYVYDRGYTEQIEFNPVVDYKIGKKYVGYLDNSANFNIYFNGEVQQLQNIAPEEYYVTDDLMLWRNTGNNLYVIYGNKGIDLAVNADSLLGYGDSVVAFLDRFGVFQLFYKGITREVDLRLPLLVRAKDNMVAYFDRNSEFRVIQYGEMNTLEYGYQPISFSVNKNIVAYVDFYGTFKVYYDGEVHTLENFQPQKYMTGEDMVAYINQDREFIVFYKGEEYKLMDLEPRFFDIQENILVYGDRNNFFNVFYNGESKLLERFIPETYKIDNDILVYPDLDNYLFGYIHGQQVPVSKEVVTEYRVDNHTVTFSKVANLVKIYCDGDIITGINR